MDLGLEAWTKLNNYILLRVRAPFIPEVTRNFELPAALVQYTFLSRVVTVMPMEVQTRVLLPS